MHQATLGYSFSIVIVESIVVQPFSINIAFSARLGYHGSFYKKRITKIT